MWSPKVYIFKKKKNRDSSPNSKGRSVFKLTAQENKREDDDDDDDVIFPKTKMDLSLSPLAKIPRLIFNKEVHCPQHKFATTVTVGATTTTSAAHTPDKFLKFWNSPPLPIPKASKLRLLW